MASLIPAEVISQLLARRGQVQTVPTGMGQAAPEAQPMPAGMFNPAQRLQTAYGMRQGRQQGGQSGMMPGGSVGNNAANPQTASIMKSMAAADLLGNDMDDNWKKLRDDPSVSPQQFEQMARQHAARRQAPQHDFSGNAAEQQQHPAGTNMALGNKGIGGMFGGRASLKPGGIAMKGPAGLTSAMAPAQQPQQAEDPVVGMVNAFRGHVPDEQLAAVQQAINAGMPPQAALAHLQQAAQHQQMIAAGNQRQQQQQAGAQQKQQHADAEKEMAAIRKDHSEIDFEGDASQFVGNDPETVKEKAIFEKYQSLKGGGAQGQQRGPAQISDKSQVASLPSGTEFVFNGHIYRKK